MKEIIRDIWQDLRSGKNLDIYINIILAGVFTILGILGIVEINVISSAILAILTLLLTSLWVNRRDSLKIQAVISKIERPDSLPEKFLDNRYETSELAQGLRNSHKVFFWGLDFATLIPALSTEIQQCLTSGLEVRSLLVEPDSKAGEMAILARPEQTADEFNDAIKRNIDHLSRLSNHAMPGKLDFRTIDYYPAFNITAFDPHAPGGWMLVRIASFRQRFPTFRLTRAKDEKWFNYFLNQFEAIWQEAKIRNP
jgi:hypothetical protein